MSVCYWLKTKLFEMACVTLCQSIWVESFKAFQRAQTLKLTCDWERFAKQNLEAWQSGLFGLSHTTCFLFFLFACAELLQNEQESEYWPSSSAPPHVISGASRKNNHCLNALSVCCPFGCSVTAWPLFTASYWITLTYHAWLQQSSEGLTWKTIQADRVYANQLIFSL